MFKLQLLFAEYPVSTCAPTSILSRRENVICHFGVPICFIVLKIFNSMHCTLGNSIYCSGLYHMGTLTFIIDGRQHA
jgi:hypothetical protein